LPKTKGRASGENSSSRRRHDLNGLIVFLEERDYVADQVGPNTIEVSRLSSVRHDHVRMELDLFLKAWHVAHPEAHAEFVEQA
jgi:hypothetical protein